MVDEMVISKVKELQIGFEYKIDAVNYVKKQICKCPYCEILFWEDVLKELKNVVF